MKKRQGLSLIEVLLSVVILGVVITAVAGSMASNLKVSSESNRQSLAVEYVDSVLEKYKIHWKSPTNYRRARRPNLRVQNRLLARGMVASIVSRGLELDGSAASSNPPPMRRVTVIVRRDGKVLARGSTLIGAPQ